ncbi:MAG: hypothetical protein CSYNP_02532 [Syntrophus sp. SKADARSKE-3]|nr:hypothetical protein [Syntrophus sp. SKADARSKE-3]
MIKTMWENLTRIQRLYVIAGAAALGVILMVQFAVLPFFAERKRIQGAIKTNEKVLMELTVLGTEFSVQKRRVEEVRAIIGRRPPDFSLFAYLERKAGEGVLKQHIKAMNTSMIAAAGEYEEVAVEMRLEKITLKQLAYFLYMVESPGEFIKVKRIVISKMKESPEYLGANLLVATYQSPVKGERR